MSCTVLLTNNHAVINYPVNLCADGYMINKPPAVHLDLFLFLLKSSYAEAVLLAMNLSFL